MIKRAAQLLVAGAVLALGLIGYRQFTTDTKTEQTSAPLGDVPVVFRTNGGLLEVGKLVYTKQFKLTEKGTLWTIEIPGCPTVATAAVKAHFVYRVRLEPEWKAKITDDKRVLVVAPPLEPAIPVAFDTATLDESLNGCWVIKDKQLLDRLRKQLSAKLAERANHPDYKRLVRDGAARTVGEFIRKWYLGRDEYAFAKDYQIVVRFKGEPIEDLM